MSELSTRVRLRREELGLSQEQLAQRMGYRSKSSITKLEKGVNDIPAPPSPPSRTSSSTSAFRRRGTLTLR